MKEKSIYSIKVVAQLTGVQENTIRSLEKRNDAVKPFRNEKGRRVYCEKDLEKIKLLKSAIDRGMNL